jgi:hypothetical protein
MEIRLIVVWGREWRDERGWLDFQVPADGHYGNSLRLRCMLGDFSSLGWSDLMSDVM